MESTLDLAWVESQLAGTAFAGQVRALGSVSSTNMLALEAAQAGVATGVWVAEEQTAGRGRGGHGWHSAAGDGLYVSLLVRPRLFGAEALTLSFAAGLAAERAVRDTTKVKVNLRWPNDLMVTDWDQTERKFGGILIESAMSGSDGALAYAVIGIGMNLNQSSMPEDLKEVATSLRRASGFATKREALLGILLPSLLGEVALLEAYPPAICERYAAASTWVHGLAVQVDEGGGYTGVTDGLDPNGLLRVRLDDGTQRTVRHGGVRRLSHSSR